MQNRASVWKPALGSGFIFGFLSGLPLVGWLNCMCCSLLLGAGVLSSYMLIKSSAELVSYGRAALAGLIAGVFAMPISFLTQLPISIILGGSLTADLQDAIEQTSDLSPEFQEAGRILMDLGAPVIAAMMFMMLLPIYGIFGTLGGVIGRALFERRTTDTITPPAGPAPPSVQGPDAPGS